MNYAARLLTTYYPHLLAVIFLIFLAATRRPAKGAFFLRELVALVIAVLLAHINRIFGLWPADLGFVSGHMTFSLGVALSLGALQRWTLAVTLPLLVPLGYALVYFHYHFTLDVVAAVPLVLVVYVTTRWLWPVPSRPLDSAGVSP